MILASASKLSLDYGGNPILDVGTGTAQIPIELCRRASDAQVVAIDLAEHMLQLGRDNVRRAGLVERLHDTGCTDRADDEGRHQKEM